MANDERDRHVLAAAIHGKAPIIVTLNLRHFNLEQQAAARGRSLRQLLDILSGIVPGFVSRVSDAVPRE